MLELVGVSDRTACIVGAAMIERILERLILARLGVTDDAPLKDLLFEREGALSTFYGNIRRLSAALTSSDCKVIGMAV
jgi:hypothetical protein